MDEKKVFADNLNYLMRRSGKTQTDIVNDLNINKSTISTWCNGLKLPRMGTIQTLADYFGVMKSDLIEERKIIHLPKNALPVPKEKKSPIRGDIACGMPMLAVDEVSDYVDIDENIPSDFSLRCHGDSMIGLHIIDGDLVHIKGQDDVENGQVAAVEVDGEFNREATLKRVRKIYNRADMLVAIELHAENPSFPVLRYDGEEMEGVHIRGLLVGVTRVVRQ